MIGRTGLFRLGRVLMAALALAALPVYGQGYPRQPVRMILPFAPGGSTDLATRAVAAKMSDGLGKAVVVENRPGVAQVAIQAVLQSPADGYTLLSITNGSISLAPYLDKLPYDTARDLVPVAMIANVFAYLAVNSAQPAQNLADLVQLARNSPKGVNVSVPAALSSSQFAAEYLGVLTGAHFITVPYKGSSPAALAVASGDVTAGVSDLGSLQPQMKSGRVRLVAVMNSTRSPVTPDVPTAAEAMSLPGFAADAWHGIFAPTGTPAEAIDRLNAEVARALAMPDVQQAFLQMGIAASTMTPAEMRRVVQEDIRRWGVMVKSTNIKVSN